LVAAGGAAVHTGSVLVPVGAGKRALGALLAEDVVLLGGELGAPFGLALFDLGRHGLSVRSPRTDVSRPDAILRPAGPSKGGDSDTPSRRAAAHGPVAGRLPAAGAGPDPAAGPDPQPFSHAQRGPAISHAAADGAANPGRGRRAGLRGRRLGGHR